VNNHRYKKNTPFRREVCFCLLFKGNLRKENKKIKKKSILNACFSQSKGLPLVCGFFATKIGNVSDKSTWGRFSWGKPDTFPFVHSNTIYI